MEDMTLYEDIECEEWYTEEGWDVILKAEDAPNSEDVIPY